MATPEDRVRRAAELPRANSNEELIRRIGKLRVEAELNASETPKPVREEKNEIDGG